MIYSWFKVDSVTASQLEELKMQEVEVGQKKVGLIKKEGSIYAFAATCPHQSASLCEGWIDAQGRIVCPLHSYRFDPANGRNTSGEGYKLKTYPLEIRDGYIYIGLIA